MASLYPFISEIFPYRSPSDLPPTEEIDMEVFSPKVPSLALVQIFPHLPLKDLVKATEVSKVWREAATHPRLWRNFDLQKLFPIKVFDYKEWAEFVDLKKYDLSFDGIGEIDNRYAIPEITGFFAELKKKNVALKDLTLLTLPKGLSVDLLKKIAAAPQKGNPMKIWCFFSPEWEREIVEESYRILITNSCLPETQQKEFGELKLLVKKIGCQVPKTLEISTLISMTYVSSNENSRVRLYRDLSTACAEEVSWSIVVTDDLETGEREWKTFNRRVGVGKGNPLQWNEKRDDSKLEIEVKENYHRFHRGIGAVKEFHGCRMLPAPITQLFTRKIIPKQTAPILGFPDEVYLEGLFNYLTPQELAKTSQVCKRWYFLAFDNSLWKSFDLEKLFRLTVFDEKSWKRYADLTKLGATVDDIGPMDLRVVIPRIVKFYARLRKEGVEIEGSKKITLLTLPKGLSLQGLEEFASEPLEGNPKIYANGWIGAGCAQTYRILITDSILKNTRNTSTDFKQRLVEKISCRIPSPFQAMALCVTRYISSPSYSPLCLYPAQPETRTQCLERQDVRILSVGGFSHDAGGIDYADLSLPGSLGVGAAQFLREPTFKPLSFGDK